MRIVEPSVELITEPNPLKRIELCGRVCYKSEDRITDDSAIKFVRGIIKRGHTSVLEHARILIDVAEFNELYLKTIDAHPYGLDDRTLLFDKKEATNVRDYLAIGGSFETLLTLKGCCNAPDYMTVRIICDRAIANEFVRHRILSFSQESTRYVNYKKGVEFVRPVPFTWAQPRPHASTQADVAKYDIWLSSMESAEKAYSEMIELGCTPQEARTVLPLSTKTELIMTGTFEHWAGVYALRMDTDAHPQIRYVMNQYLTVLQNLPEFPEALSDMREQYKY